MHPTMTQYSTRSRQKIYQLLGKERYDVIRRSNGFCEDLAKHDTRAKENEKAKEKMGR